jgi:glycosyltransferase involved in cell wall biosynthesis
VKEKYVLDVYCVSDFGGAERRLIRVYNEIAKKYDCDIVFRGSSKKKILEILEKSDCNIDNINKVYYFRYSILSLLYFCFVNKYNNIHVFDVCGYNKALLSIMKKKGIKTLLTIAFQNYAYGIIDDKTKKMLTEHLDLATKVDVLFPAGEKYLKEISKNSNVTVTPGTFTKTELFVPIKKEKLMIYVARRLEHDKNASMLIEACNICQDDIRKFGYKILICGKDGEEEILRRKIYEFHLEDILEMPGYVVTSTVFPKAEVYISIDLIDNYPSQTIAEAVSSGCSLICTNVGYSKMCGSEEFSKYINVDATELANAIREQMKKNVRQKNENIIKAREYALKYYSIAASAEYFSKLIRG